MKVLVTGASGFIGKALVKALIDKHPNIEVFCAVRKTSKRDELQKLRVDFVEFDLTDILTQVFRINCTNQKILSFN